jgi:hypothetical protein
MLMAAPATSVHSHDSAQPQILQEPTRVARRRIDDTTHRAPPPPPIRRCRLRFQISCSAHCVDTCICSERAERAHDGQEVHHQHSEEELNMFTLLDCSLYFTRARATGTPIGQEPFTDTPLHSQDSREEEDHLRLLPQSLLPQDKQLEKPPLACCCLCVRGGV